MRRTAALLMVLLLAQPPFAPAGGPLIVGGTFGQPGVPFTWSTAAPVPYRIDAGTLGKLTNAQAVARVGAMFAVWQDVPTATISYSYAGPLLGTTGFVAGGDVDTAAEFNAVSTSCDNGQQNPIIFDTNGSLFSALGLPPGVIGFAGPCAVSSQGRIVSGMAALNGAFINNNTSDGELMDDEFDAAFIHEFGHFSGLDHSQISSCFGCGTTQVPATPTMYPFLIGAEQRSLAPDDVAWISALYPTAEFTATYGRIQGRIYFSDGMSGVQGANLVAGRVDDPGTPLDERTQAAVSVVSGYLFTSSLGQTMSGTNNSGSSFGGRTGELVGWYEIPLLPGEYRLEVSSVDAAFVGGSSVGPLSPPIPLPGQAPAPIAVTVTPGGVTQIDVVLQQTPPRFDRFEGPDLGASGVQP